MRAVQVGDIGEIAFILRAKLLGFEVSKPFTSDCAYDCILDNNKTLLKIQIKTCSKKSKSRKDSYQIKTANTNSDNYHYTEIDYFAFYLIDIDTFYIIPVNEINAISVWLYPYNKDHRYFKFIEAWSLLK